MPRKNAAVDEVVDENPGDSGAIKGPDPAHWDDDARAERGADLSDEARAAQGPQFGDDGELVKGPDPDHWDDSARAERGAERSEDQVAEQGAAAVRDPWTDDEIAAARKALEGK